MTQADERILEFVSEYGNHPPKAICDRLSEIGGAMNYNPSYIRRECRKLADYGLLKNVGSGTYSLTELGTQFLEGQVDASEIVKKNGADQ
ncbi:PhiH1 repressor-like protein [Haloferax sp. ATCC BAA-645]|nr:PhiH1 repressor-like protein [Haloferax sp. ATCC BAA-645]